MFTIREHAAKKYLLRLMNRAANGQEIVITRGGKPMVRMVPLELPDRPTDPRPKRPHRSV